MPTKIKTNNAPQAIGAYSQAVVKNDMLFVSGQLPINPDTNKMSDNIEIQTEQSLKNIQSILQASDMNLDNIVKNTIYVTSLEHADQINKVYGSFFETLEPARAMVGVKELPKNASIEIESIAMK